MEAEHTPGPWTVSERKKFRVRISGVTWDSFAKVVVRTVGTETDSPQGLANARLICAAPDLLAALKEVVAVSDRDTDIYARAHLIIAKAEGKSDATQKS